METPGRERSEKEKSLSKKERADVTEARFELGDFPSKMEMRSLLGFQIEVR